MVSLDCPDVLEPTAAVGLEVSVAEWNANIERINAAFAGLEKALAALPKDATVNRLESDLLLILCRGNSFHEAVNNAAKAATTIHADLARFAVEVRSGIAHGLVGQSYWTASATRIAARLQLLSDVLNSRGGVRPTANQLRAIEERICEWLDRLETGDYESRKTVAHYLSLLQNIDVTLVIAKAIFGLPQRRNRRLLNTIERFYSASFDERCQVTGRVRSKSLSVVRSAVSTRSDPDRWVSRCARFEEEIQPGLEGVVPGAQNSTQENWRR